MVATLILIEHRGSLDLSKCKFGFGVRCYKFNERNYLVIYLFMI